MKWSSVLDLLVEVSMQNFDFSSHFEDIVLWSLDDLVSKVSTLNKDRELGDAYTEIKALKYHEHLKEKAVEEVLLLFAFLQSIITIEFYVL
ncbi:hypothetical protein L6452_28482 [Arctium lappa]|uniref:Uncharacterized protein n=1 Tax=Arctium lappa TaxID=4217 RepID=A0ACB9A2X3_ARCLA|nr:hypothetical protein L6452_28482 [Arctium lappa]